MFFKILNSWQKKKLRGKMSDITAYELYSGVLVLVYIYVAMHVCIHL